MRTRLLFVLLLLGAGCRAESALVPRCPPCPCRRDMAEAARLDLAAADLGAAPDLLCAPVTQSCVDLPCCAGLVCVGGACALLPAR